MDAIVNMEVNRSFIRIEKPISKTGIGFFMNVEKEKTTFYGDISYSIFVLLSL
jgi:hypothetical protein